MALPSQYLETFGADEISFQAEDEPITIIPRQSMPPMTLAGWQVPALRPRRQTQVPLWLALLLKRQGKCVVVFPDWMDEDRMKAYVDKERAEGMFSSLPWLWQPVAQLLLATASDDYPGSVDALRHYLQDLREIRQEKVRQGLTLINESHVQMDGLGLMELNEVRPLLARSMASLQQIRN